VREPEIDVLGTVKEHHNRVSKKAIHAPHALNEAYSYARPSSFSRGLRLDIKGITILLISGTASVDECELKHKVAVWQGYALNVALVQSSADLLLN